MAKFNVGDKVQFTAEGSFCVYEVVQTREGLGIKRPETGNVYVDLDWDEVKLVQGFQVGDKVRFAVDTPHSITFEVVQTTTDGLALKGPTGHLYSPNRWWSWSSVVLIERSEEIDRTNPPKCDSMPPCPYANDCGEKHERKLSAEAEKALDEGFAAIKAGAVVSVTLDGKTYKTAPGAELATGAPEFKAGDKVRALAYMKPDCLQLDTDYTVESTRNGAHGLCLVLEEFSDWVTGFYAWRFERAPVPSIKDARRRAQASELKRALDQQAEVQQTVNQALRFNSNKPESDYILTYAGGVKATFDEDFDYYGTLEALSDVYSSQTVPDCSLGALLDALRGDAGACGDDIIARLADTNTKGGKKYAQGNYLKGANWRQYFQGAVRHAQNLQNGDERDAEGFSHRGNFFFNVLALHHCITTGIGTDDRVKVPA